MPGATDSGAQPCVTNPSELHSMGVKTDCIVRVAAYYVNAVTKASVDPTYSPQLENATPNHTDPNTIIVTTVTPASVMGASAST